MTKNILTIVNNKDLSEDQMKREIRELICNKIVDGTNLTSKDRIDIVECGWICYRLNRDAGRSRVVSHMLAITVIIDAIGFMLFGQRNKLRDLTNLIYATAKRPVGYAIWTFGRKTISYFLPALIAFLGWTCGAQILMDIGKGLGDAWKTISFDRNFFSSLGDAVVGLGVTTGANLPFAIAGVALVSISNTLRNLFAAIYAVYISIFNSLKRRDPNSKVDRKEINQKSIMGLESFNKKNNERLVEGDGGSISFMAMVGRQACSVLVFTCLSTVMQFIIRKLGPKINQIATVESYLRYSEEIITGALLAKLASWAATTFTVGNFIKFFKTLLIDTPLQIGSFGLSVWGHVIRPIVAFILWKILWPYIKGLVGSFFDMLPGLLSAIRGFIGNIVADVDEYICKLLQKAINDKSTKALNEEENKLKSDIIKMSNNPVFKGKGTDVQKFINKVEKASNTVITKVSNQRKPSLS